MRPLGKKRSPAIWALCAALGLNGCATSHFSVPRGTLDEAAYVSIYPYYLEYCAVSEFNKKPGLGLDINSGGPGGHSVFYLNGVCRVRDAGYPEIALCDATGESLVGRGVGISVNDHFSNANFLATEGRTFFLRGDLAPGEALTHASYARTQAKAKAMGIFDGIAFHPKALAGKPAGMSEQDYIYNVSVATDYAISFGRDRYCARLPLDRARMGVVVDYLNARNAPYRAGQAIFQWDVLRNNCAHLARNALAQIGLWPETPTDRPWWIAAFDFPVPKNEFVNLMRRTNDLPVTDPDALHDDADTRSALLRHDWIATRPGGLAQAEPAVADNELYETKLRLIFFDEAISGPYQGRFDRIFAEPRYTDLRSNLAYFAELYATILARRQTEEAADGGGGAPPGGLASFQAHYYRHIAAEHAKLQAARAALRGASG